MFLMLILPFCTTSNSPVHCQQYLGVIRNGRPAGGQPKANPPSHPAQDEKRAKKEAAAAAAAKEKAHLERLARQAKRSINRE